jgi:fatty-acyl-CoA synthase
MALTVSYRPAVTTDEIRPTTIGSVLRDATAAAPDRDALVAGMPDPADRRRWTYTELLADAEQTAHALLGRFDPGEHVGVWAPNIAEWVILQYGAALAGLVLVTINPAYQAAELEYVLRQSRTVGLFTLTEYRTNPMAKSVESVRAGLPDLRDVVLFHEWADFVAGGAHANGPLPDVGPDDTAALLYTSGTTGFPKGALLHHRGVTNDSRLVTSAFGLAVGDTQVSPMPLFHVGGCVLAVLGTASVAGTYVPVVAFDPALMLELIEVERPTLMGGVPTMLLAMMEHPDCAARDLSSLKVVGSGGSTVPADLVRRIQHTLGVQFSIVFGQTECSAVATQTRLDDSPNDKAETIGQPLPNVEVKVIDAAGGETVPPGTLGELCVRGFCVMTGYYDMPEATDAAIDADGWLHTGDLGTMDERGYLRIEGRLKDMIIRGGENIYPREIEAVLYEHPGVADVAVVGVPDDRWGEQVVAFVRLVDDVGVTPSELAVYARERLAAYKTPRTWVFVEAFPLTGSGKVQKFVLRERFVNGDLTPAT